VSELVVDSKSSQCSQVQGETSDWREQPTSTGCMQGAPTLTTAFQLRKKYYIILYYSAL